MLGALSGDFFQNKIAYLMKYGETKRSLFKFLDLEFKNAIYNQVGTNIVSQRVDRAIQTNWSLDFNIKDTILIGEEKYMIIDIPPFEKINPLGKFDKLVTLRLLKLAN